MLDLNKSLQSVLKKHSALTARREQHEAQNLRTTEEVKKAQHRLQAQESVQELLEYMQKKEHERAVGAYEDLLGAFLSDVLPGERSVAMELYTERGAPALDLYIQKGEGAPLEDAFRGTGGSVTNLLSTGLRLVALMRSGARKFLVLDESDCWIEPSLIPQYAGIVAEMSDALDVQILMISHHNESLFAGHIPFRLRMTKTGQVLGTEWSADSDIPVWEEERHGLRSLTLHDFQSHQHTIIPLAPSVTLLQGANDIGKSAVVNALRAVFDGESHDTLIRHHKNEARVVVDMGPENILTWSRFRKGKVKVSYKLQNIKNEVLHESSGTKVPEWLVEHAKIGKIEGLDVQIGQQQDPVFLLNQPASVRAKALSIGLESGHIQNMMAQDKQEVTEARQTVKSGEKTLEYLRQANHILSTLKETGLTDSFMHLEKEQNKMYEARKAMEQWQKLSLKEKAFGKTTTALPSFPLQKSHAAKELFQFWSQRERVENILQHSSKPLPKMPPVRTEAGNVYRRWMFLYEKNIILNEKSHLQKNFPERGVLEKSEAMLKRWIKNEKRKIILQDLPELPSIPLQRDTTLWKRIVALQENERAKLKDLHEAQKDLLHEEHNFFEAVEECPTCGNLQKRET